jgi:ribosomal-protein-alanine N-acetyltransferase
MLKVHIRWMICRDLPEVLQIEEASFPCPWTEEDFLRCQRQRNCIGMVAEHGETIVGYMLYELHKHHLALLNFAVHPGHRRQGVGVQMARKLQSKLSSHRRTKIETTVRESNLAALHFWHAVDFKAVGIERGFYDDTAEDAIHLAHWLDEPEPVPLHNRIAHLTQE